VRSADEASLVSYSKMLDDDKTWKEDIQAMVEEEEEERRRS